MSTSPPRVGADIESECRKCGSETWHVILAMVGRQIAKVQCKGCGAQHRFKSASEGATRAPRARAAGAKGAGRPSRAGAKQAAPQEPVVEPDLSRPVRRYAVDATFAVGDRLDHPQFGQGVVEICEAGKITVWFPSGRRVLAQAQAQAQLQRRRPVPSDTE